MITTKDISILKKSLESITPLIQETNVRFSDSGIYIKAIDKTQILLVDFYMPKKSFGTYSIDPNLIGLNILELQNMISRCFDKDKLQLDLKEQHLDITLKGKIERNFQLPYMDLSQQDVEIPDLKYDVSLKLNSGLLKEIIKDVSLVATTLVFRVQDNKFIVESTSEKGKIKTVVPQVKLKSKKNFIVKYSLSFLRNITKAIDSDSEIVLKLAEDTPLYLEYNLNEEVKIKFYLSSMLI